MTEQRLSDLIQSIQEKEYELGKIVQSEDFANKLLELASNAFVVGDDRLAKYLRDLSKGIGGKAETARNFYNSTYRDQGQAAIDELHKKCVKK